MKSSQHWGKIKNKKELLNIIGNVIITIKFGYILQNANRVSNAVTKKNALNKQPKKLYTSFFSAAFLCYFFFFVRLLEYMVALYCTLVHNPKNERTKITSFNKTIITMNVSNCELCWHPYYYVYCVYFEYLLPFNGAELLMYISEGLIIISTQKYSFDILYGAAKLCLMFRSSIVMGCIMLFHYYSE